MSKCEVHGIECRCGPIHTVYETCRADKFSQPRPGASKCYSCVNLMRVPKAGEESPCPPCHVDRERGKGQTGFTPFPNVGAFAKSVPERYDELLRKRPLHDLNTSKPGEGLRFNKGKRRYDLIPVDALAALADLFTIGANKYAERNWEKGMSYQSVIASLDRHWNDFKAGIDRDPETGCLHITHVVWNAMALLTFMLRGIGTDDRVKVTMPEQVNG